jgi:hypothetical protein
MSRDKRQDSVAALGRFLPIHFRVISYHNFRRRSYVLCGLTVLET